jgi:hypothetical protein
MPGFSSKWLIFSGKRPSMEVAKVAKAPFATFATPIEGRSGKNSGIPEAPEAPDASHLQGRLQRGQAWLAEQHGRWLAGDLQAVSDEEFSRALAGWDSLERQLRSLGYGSCICGPERCPADTVATCDACIPGSTVEAQQPVGVAVQGGLAGMPQPARREH